MHFVKETNYFCHRFADERFSLWSASSDDYNHIDDTNFRSMEAKGESDLVGVSCDFHQQHIRTRKGYVCGYKLMTNE